MSKKILSALLSFLLVIVMITPALAWLSIPIKATFPDNISGSTEIAYFESGTGSVDDPYIISNKAHLYNLAWLQYIGYFNLNDRDNNNNARAQSYFKLKNDIDMDGLSIPPIGTTQYPFLGNFNGNGKKIIGCITANALSALEKHPVRAQFIDSGLLGKYVENSTDEAGQVIGLFGVIGDYNNEVSRISGISGYSASDATPPTANDDGTVLYTQAISAYNFSVDGYQLQNYTNATTVGIAAGYVNAPLTGVKLSNSTVDVKKSSSAFDATAMTENVSDYTLVGYCTPAYRSQLNVHTTDVYSPLTTSEGKHVIQDNTGDGDATGWGGSIAMDNLYDTLEGVFTNNATMATDYVYAFERVKAAGSDTYTITGTTTNGNFRVSNINDDYFSVTYTLRSANNTSDTTYLYISGGAKRTDRVYSYTGKTGTGYKYSMDGRYLNVTTTGTPALTSGTAENGATAWVLSTDRYMYTDIGGIIWYLNADGTTLSLSMTPTTQWTYQDGVLSTGNYRLTYQNNAWALMNTNGVQSYISTQVGNTTYYLSNNGTTLTSTTNQADATVWTFSGNNEGTISTTVNNTTYYLYGNNNNLTLNATSTTWENSNNQLYYSRRGLFGTTTYYFRYNNGWTLTTSENDAATLTFTEVALPTLTTSETVVQEIIAEEETTTLDFTHEQSDSTYIPLAMDDTYQPKNNNTGYITSGTWDETSTPGYPIRSGDIRVSEYGTDDIYDHNNVYVIDKSKTDGSFTTMSLTSDGKSEGFVKFADCKDKYSALLSASSGNLYGLHFMNGIISKDVQVTIPQATINGKSYTNYKVPSDCIDFNLKERGYINFFAGTYFDGNDCFFSLHHIVRDVPGEGETRAPAIQSIKEIDQIYHYPSADDATVADPSKPYIYLYTDGTYSQALTTGYEKCFDMDWLKTPNITKNCGYYFEVPVNAGEYALGSVEGGTGAYLLYLDLSANAQEVERTKVTEIVTETVTMHSYASGVTVDGADAAGIAFTMKPSYTGSFTVGSGANGTVTYTAGSANHIFITASAGAILSPTDSVTLTPEIPIKIITTKRVTFIERNTTTNEVATTVITYVETDLNGEKTFTITATVQEGENTPTDQTELIVKGTTNGVTALNSTKKDDSIDWTKITEDETGRSHISTYTYQYSIDGEGATVSTTPTYTAAVMADDGSVTTPPIIDIVVETSKDITINVTDFNSDCTLTIGGVTVTTEGQEVAVATTS